MFRNIKQLMTQNENLENLFCTQINSINNIGLLCYSMTDEEALEETSYFLCKTYKDLKNDTWEKKWNAISFFSSYAFYFFFPSMMMNIMKKPEENHMAFFEIYNSIKYLYPPDEGSYKSSTRVDKWLQFNSLQLGFIKKIMPSLEIKLEKYGISVDESLAVRESIDSLINLSKILENKIKCYRDMK